MSNSEYTLLSLNDKEFINNNNISDNDNEVDIAININGNNEIINDFVKNKLDNNNNDLNNSNVEGNNKEKQSRVYWVDCLRIFSSILVVYIHVSFINTEQERGEIFLHNWNGLFFHNSIPRHCVPLFVMISGIFFLNPSKKITFKKLYMNNIFHMVKSYFFWSTYYAIINNYVVNLFHNQYTFNMGLIAQTFYNIILPGGHLWYLPFVIGLYIMTPIYRSIMKERQIAWYVVFISMFLAQFLPTLNAIFVDLFKININMVTDFFGSLKIELIGSYTVYYLLGYLLYTHDFNNKKKYFSLCYAIGIVCLIITIVFRFLEVYNKKKEDNDFGKYSSIFVSLTTISTFIFFKYNVSKWINPLMKNEIIKKIVLKLSECSFGVYLVHMSIYDLLHRFNFHSVTFDPYYWVPIYSIIIYIICFLLIYLLRKIELFKLVT